MQYYIIERHLPVEEARKDINCDGKTPYKGEVNDVSEWAMAVALCTFKIGQKVSEKEMNRAIQDACMLQTLQQMDKDGLIESMWDSEQSDVVYRIKE